MRIAMVSEHASPLATLGGLDAGGQNVHVAALAAELESRGHHITVYTRQDSRSLPDRITTDAGYEVAHVRAGPPTEIPKDQIWRHMETFADNLAPMLLAGGHDLVHTHFWMSAWATLDAVAREASLNDLPVLHTFHALGVVKRRHQGAADTSPPERLRVERDICSRVDRVLATAHDEVSELVRLGIDPDRCSVVPCGVDIEVFAPRDPLRPADRYPFEGRPRYRLLVLGRLVERKGIAEVVTALRWLPDAEVVIVGGPSVDALDLDPAVQRLRRLAVAVGVADRVRFVGPLPHDLVPAMINACDVVVSVPWYEPFGMVPLEAMACGRPIVGSAVGGLLDSVAPGETGELVPPRDAGRLAETLRTLLADPELRRRYGANGSRRVRSRFSWHHVAAATEAAYASQLEQTATEGVRRLAGVRQ
jgi:glycosyltransferase involved in cell wall biosynthesis